LLTFDRGENVKASGFLIFAGLLTVLSGLVHWYLWARLVRDAAWPTPWSTAAVWLLIGLGASIPLAVLALPWSPRWVSGPLSWTAYAWMGFLFYLFVLSLATDVGRGMAAVVGATPADPERRLFLARSLAGGIALASVLIGGWGIVKAARGFQIRRVRVPLAKLPGEAAGYVIAHITDMHVGPTLGRDFAEAVVAATNALIPDLIVVTGDLVDGSVEQLRDHVEPLRNLKARDGVFFVTGNHEYYSGADAWIAHLQVLGMRVLRNERVDIRGIFDLAGVDDAGSGRMLPHHGQDVAKAAAGRDPERALVLLAHQPKALSDAVAAGVDLQLSGHVHGGQIMPFNWLAAIDQPVVSGLRRIKDTWIYVSEGTGYWGPPMRVGTVSEIARIELVPESRIG
jgi:predicted MPP superfamily phosphohydrolase